MAADPPAADAVMDSKDIDVGVGAKATPPDVTAATPQLPAPPAGEIKTGPGPTTPEAPTSIPVSTEAETKPAETKPADAKPAEATTTTTTTTNQPQPTAPAPTSQSAAPSSQPDIDASNPLDFEGTVNTNNDLPSPETLAKIGDYMLLDRDGKSHPFRSLYAGKHVARRVLVIFVRHFFCGNCQQYLRALSSSITPEALLRLPLSTFIAVVGCGDPGLIDMYATETGCPFPIYTDPTRKLYDELGMLQTLALGERPAYQKEGIVKSSLASIVQGLKQIKSGLATKAGPARQIGGEFLFEPVDLGTSPVGTPWAEVERRMGDFGLGTDASAAQHRASDTSLDGKGEENDEGGVEAKTVTWCHRMRTTRDHAEIPELMEVLGLDGQGMPIKDKKRWSRAIEQRKGTGLSMASQMSAMKAEAGVGTVTGAEPRTSA